MSNQFGKSLTYISEHLQNSSGETNANVDGSETPVLYKISPPSSGKIVLARMLVLIRDTGNFSAEKYGVLSELTNGVSVGIYDDATDTLVQNICSGGIRNNVSWGGLCYDVDLKAWGNGDEFSVARWTFSRSGIFIHLSPWNGFALGVQVNDDLTGLVEHRFLVQGYQKA